MTWKHWVCAISVVAWAAPTAWAAPAGESSASRIHTARIEPGPIFDALAALAKSPFKQSIAVAVKTATAAVVVGERPHIEHFTVALGRLYNSREFNDRI